MPEEKKRNEVQLIKSVPKAFISYSWDSEELKSWVGSLGTRLRSDGLDLILDEWHLRPGDQLPHFMECAIRDSDFVLVVCTPQYKKKANNREGGVGFEGNIIGGEVLAGADDRKFIPILKEGEWRESAPSWLLGKLFIDLRGDPYREENYEQLLSAMYGLLPEAPSVGLLPRSAASQQLAPEAITRQRAYADLVNATLRVQQAAQNRLLLKKQGDAASRMLLPEVESELEEQSTRVNELIQEINLFSSEPVRKAAGEVAGWALGARISSTVPPGMKPSKIEFLEEKLAEFREKLAKESISKFRAEIRKEANLQ